MNLEDLFESPQWIESQEFGLDKISSNISRAKELLGDSKQAMIAEIFPSVNLYKIANQYALINVVDQYSPVIWYYVKYETKYRKFLNNTCIQQVVVWRKMTEPKTDGFAKKMFFDYLLPETGCIITDALQTSSGQRFWMARINDAFSLSLPVYMVDLMPPQKIIKLENPQDIDTLLSDESVWGDHKSYQTKRIIITQNQL